MRLLGGGLLTAFLAVLVACDSSDPVEDPSTPKSASVSPGAASVTPAEASWATYQHPDGAVTVSYPEDWSVRDVSEEAGADAYVIFDDGKHGGGVSIVVQPRARLHDPSASQRELLRGMAEATDLEVVDESTATFAGRSGYRMIVRTRKGFHLVETVLAFSGNTSVMLTCNYTEGDTEAVAGCRAMADSVQLGPY